MKPSGTFLKPLVTGWTFIKSNWQGIIATCSFLIALTALYHAQLKPFEPHVRGAGRYALSKNDGNPQQLAISWFLNFANLGIRAGTIDNIYAVFHTSHKESKLLIPRYDIIDPELNTARAIRPLKAAVFSAFTLGGKETIQKKIMLVPFQAEERFEPPTGIYSLEIFAKSSRN